METKLRRLGTSRCVIIPKAFITQCGLGENIDIAVENNSVVLRPVDDCADWADAYASYEPTAEETAEMLEWQAFGNDFDKEWEW